jgi:hypothetical protein
MQFQDRTLLVLLRILPYNLYPAETPIHDIE